jgi:hypothetical protein
MSPAEAWLEANTTRRRGKLVLKPGVVPHDASTAFAGEIDEVSESQSAVTSNGVAAIADIHLPESSSSAADKTESLLLSQIHQPPMQHQRKGSEESSETAPTVASVSEDDTLVTDNEEAACVAGKHAGITSNDG